MPDSVSDPPVSSPHPSLLQDNLTPSEHWWRDRQPWLAQQGYVLRSRYMPGWVPSWSVHPEIFAMECEDWYSSKSAFILDATRASDGKLVVLKRVKRSLFPQEVDIAKLLSADVESESRNHTVPILDILDVPDDQDVTILVMPLLRAFNDPPWQTVGEVVAFLLQVFEGMQYMHEKNVSHRDCQGPNIMFDPQPMYPKMFHPRVQDRSHNWKGKPKHLSRTERPVKYYYIDFGLSRKYDKADGPPRERPIRGGDKSVPEFQDWNGQLLDPFPTDIYYLGNTIRTYILQTYQGLELLDPLVEDMVHQEPDKRPTIRAVVGRFHLLLKSLGHRKLRSRIVPRDEDAVQRFFRSITHTFRTARYILTRKPAIPLPS